MTVAIAEAIWVCTTVGFFLGARSDPGIHDRAERWDLRRRFENHHQPQTD
jgi:hypothetical protein